MDQQQNEEIEKIVDILEIFQGGHSRHQGMITQNQGVHPGGEGVRDKEKSGEGRKERSSHPLYSLQLEPANSLALSGRHSIDNVLPIPRTMLSRSEDAFQSQDRQYQQKQVNESSVHLNHIEEQLVNSLNLTDLVQEEGNEPVMVENTKNVLRNFGNAQNHYVLYNEHARAYLEANLTSLHDFDNWIRSLKLQNFVNFKKAWSEEESKLFTRVYKKLCWDFYTNNSIPYVLSSRIKKSQTRNSHLRYIFRFLQGLRNPKDFTYFRKS